MNIGAMRIEMHIAESASLKDKRRVLSRLKDRIKNRFNVSIAEIEEMDKWQTAVLGIAAVSNDKRHLSKCLDGIISFIEDEKKVMVVDYSVEML